MDIRQRDRMGHDGAQLHGAGKAGSRQSDCEPIGSRTALLTARHPPCSRFAGAAAIAASLTLILFTTFFAPAVFAIGVAAVCLRWNAVLCRSLSNALFRSLIGIG